jgi:sec-independent protein translocase protein TatA
MYDIIPLFPGLPGGPELLIVLLVLVLLFGANKIPKLARSTGQAMGEFKKGREEIEEELQGMEGESDSPTEPTTSTDSETASEPATERSTTDN